MPEVPFGAARRAPPPRAGGGADATGGFLGTLEDGRIRDRDGAVVWDLDAYGFLDHSCPASVDPSLWRQSRLVAGHGLFEVVPGIYQVRGFDLSNMTIVEGERGVLVAPDAKWCGDITYIPTGESGFMYLATVIEVSSGRLIGWSIAEHHRAEIVRDALAAAESLFAACKRDRHH